MSLAAVVLCVSSASPVVAAAPEPPLTVAFSGATVTATGVTPGASVLFFAVVTKAVPWGEGVGKLDAIVADDDRDGTVTYTMSGDESVPPRSIWSVCDLENGNLAVAGPAGYVPLRVEMPGNGLRRGTSGQIEKLELGGSQWLEVAVVRPKKGAWTTTIHDGGPADDDRVNDGHIRRGFAGLRALAGSEAPDRLTGRDVVIVIDPGTMRYYASRIEQ